MSKEKLLAALPFAALCAAILVPPHAAGAGQQGVVVTRDAETGKFRETTVEELKALVPASTVDLRARVPLESLVVTRPNGSRVLRLADRGLVYMVATRDASGKLVEQCVDGEHGVAQALAQPASSARHNKEHRHEER